MIGSDWPSGPTFPVIATPAAGAVPTTAPEQGGDQARCAKVNPVYTW